MTSQIFYIDPNKQIDPKVIEVLERVHQSRQRIRIHYGYTGPDPDNLDVEIGRSWGEEHDVIGTVGRSTGSQKIPLLIANARSMGGGGILVARIIRIQSCPEGYDLYTHPNYKPTEYHIQDLDHPLYKFAVIDDRDVHVASFQRIVTAQHYIQFMRGERFTLGGK